MIKDIRKINIGFQEGTCPLKCKKCYAFGENAKAVKEVKKMPLEQAKCMIDEISRLEKIPSIQPSIYTEPFANNDLKIIIPYCQSRGVPLNIITNGILLDKEWMDILIKCLDFTSVISFSLDAVTQETYEKVRGEYNLETLERKVEYLMNKRKRDGLRVSVNFVYEEDNYNEKEAFLEKWKNRVDAVRITAALDSNKRILDKYRKEDVIKKCGECPYLIDTMTIDTEGEVRTCPMDAFGETNLGNVFEEGIESIWHGSKIDLLRLKHRQGQLSPGDFCYGCEWGDSVYDFGKVEETENYIIKIANYAMYYNCKHHF